MRLIRGRESTTNFLQTFPDSSQVSAPLRCQRQNRPILRKGLGYSREELIGSHRSVFEVSTSPSFSACGSVSPLGKRSPSRTRHKRKDGTSFPVEVRVGHLEQGGLRFLCLVRDITERKRAEEALRRSEAYLAEAQRLTRTGSWAWDPQRDKILHCSEEIYRIYGVDARDGVPKYETLLQRIHPEDRDQIRESTLEGVRQKIECLLDYRIVLPDGKLKYIQSIRRPVLDTDGNVYPVHVMTRKSFGLMMRKLSVTKSQRSAQFPGTFSRRKLSVASANWAQVA